MSRITGLRATYRCLEDVALDLTDPDTGAGSPFIALVGANGAGKTTILEAIALCAWHTATRQWQNPFTDTRDWHIELDFSGDHLTCARSQAGLVRLDMPQGAQAIRDASRGTLYIRSGYLPLMPVNEPLHLGPAAKLSWDAALRDQPKERITAVHQWWLHQHLEYPTTTRLDRLWQALAPFLGDLVYAGVNPNDHLPCFDARGHTVTFNELSSGERRIVLLFMEIAMHCGEDGIVLFDEPEAHFHPVWQRMLPNALQELVPGGQIIVATHAPHVVEGLAEHQVFTFGERPW